MIKQCWVIGSWFFLDILTLQDKAPMLSWYARNQPLSDAAPYTKRKDVSSETLPKHQYSKN